MYSYSASERARFEKGRKVDLDEYDESECVPRRFQNYLKKLVWGMDVALLAIYMASSWALFASFKFRMA